MLLEWHVRSTCWATERGQRLSRCLLVEAKVRGQKSGQANLGGNSLLDVLGDCVKVVKTTPQMTRFRDVQQAIVMTTGLQSELTMTK